MCIVLFFNQMVGMTVMRKAAVMSLLSLAVSSALIAGQPSGGDFVISKSTIDTGGGMSTGGDFRLTGTMGQPDASPQISTGADIQLSGGFWALIANGIADLIFKDGFE